MRFCEGVVGFGRGGLEGGSLGVVMMRWHVYADGGLGEGDEEGVYA